MNRDTIFTVTKEHLKELDLNTSVEFFRNLLWAEARRLGIEISKISVSSWVNVPDGGVDATVDDAQIAKPELIKPGKTSYQIKSGAEFKPWRKSVIKKALFGEKTPELQNLGESIRACLNAESTYVLVCTGIDPVVPQREKILSNIAEYLKQCGYSEPKVEVFTQNTLIGFLQAFPSLALSVNERSGADFQTHQSWSQDGTMDVPFVPGATQGALIEEIRDKLREDISAVHVRVLGKPGIGKTKLVLEATRTDDLAPLVIYSTAAQFRTGELMREILRDDNHFSAVLVIDECAPDSRFYIWDKLQNQGPRIKLVSIYNERDPVVSRDISVFEVERLNNDKILDIIQGYRVSKEKAEGYLPFCGGSPRMAHRTGEVLFTHPDTPSELLNDDYLYKSFYVDFSRESPESLEVQQRELVLQHIALFRRFGFGGRVVVEAQAITAKVKEADEQITWSRFQKIVDELKRRKILQGEFTLYITPEALHIKLWVEWWQVYGNPFDLETFTQGLPPELVDAFHEMFRYAAESEPASEIVKGLLGPNGPFQNSEYLNTRRGSRFFSALTEADPKSALQCLTRTIGILDRKALLQFKDGRRYVVWALEKIAMHRELFVEAARLLLALGEAENEGCSNNASGVFANLFSPGWGAGARTEAPPVERLPVLKEAFESESKERRILALKACRKGLVSDRFSRMLGAEYQELWMLPKLWQPKTYGELWDAYRHVWQLLSEQLALLPEDEREEAVEILLEQAGSLARIPHLSEMVINTLITITENRYANEKQIIETVSRILLDDDAYVDNTGLPAEIRQRFEVLRDELVGSDFHSLMRRYVGMYLPEDAPLDNGEVINPVQSHLETLANQVVENPTLLKGELPWLVTSEAKNGYRFGYQLGQKDSRFALLPTLLDAQRNTGDTESAYFLGGYFRALFETNTAKWEKQLDALIEDNTLNLLIPELTHRSGLTARAGLRLLHLAKEGIIDINRFDIFTYSRAIENLSEAVFTAWIEFLLNVSEKSAVSIALCLYHRYYVGQKPKPTLPADLTFQLLTHPSFFEESNENRFRTMIEHYWIELGKAFLQRYPEKCLELVALMLAHFGTKGTIVPGFKAKTTSLLTEVMKKFPEQVWERVSKYLDASVETNTNFSRSTALEWWLQGAELSKTEKGAITLIPHKKIWEWIDKNVENRASVLARSFVPKTLIETEWQTSLARTILTRYGEREDVRHALISNYLEGVGLGPASLHYDTIKQKLLHIKNTEDDGNVICWLDEYIATLEEQIKHAKIDEERMF